MSLAGWRATPIVKLAGRRNPMRTLRNLELFTFAAVRGRKWGSMEKFRLLKMALIIFVVCAATAIPSPAQTFTTLFSFSCTSQYYTDGANPSSPLVQATDGNFYGATRSGGGANCGASGAYGTLFKITAGGALTTLHTFDGTDGATAYGKLVEASEGNFYGTTYVGGANANGTVFKITPSGTLTTLHSFDDTDGAGPGGLIQASDGNFYGTTWVGGANGYGTVFKITPAGALTTLHSFDVTDGALPTGGLVQATDGNFYGTTNSGGSDGCGTVFSITPAGTLTTLSTLYYYDPQPWQLIQATDGNFYGTAEDNGTYANGSVFRLSVGLGPFVKTEPSSGKVGAAVIILGTNLTGATSVSFNGTAATFTVVSSSEIQTTVPAGATTGTVTVVTPSGTLHSNKNFVVTTPSTSTALTSSPNPSVWEQSVTFTATVAPTPDGGTVTFTYGSTTLCAAVALANGVATCVYSALPAGSDTVTAAYSGDTNFASSSGTVVQKVNRATTTTKVISSPNPSQYNQSVTFTATVTPTPDGGTVTFTHGSTTLCAAVALANGVATCVYSALPAGSDTVTAAYSGDTNFAPS